MNYDLNDILYKYYGFSSFRTGQKEMIEDVLKGNHVLGILPTGSGKSLCYQLPARVVQGHVLVVSPLISLMIDQVKQLKAEGFKEVIAINSFLNASEKKTVMEHLDAYKLIYVSPEMLQNNHFIHHLTRLDISLFVVDEAHCISQWGHEFRPDYLKLRDTIAKLSNPVLLALSATATPEVQADIIQQLGVPFHKHVYPMDRDNIAFMICHTSSDEEKLGYIHDVLDKFPVPTMIYFSSRIWTEKAAGILEDKLPQLRIAFYHGGMQQSDRILIQQQYMREQLDVICCTSAFGMGINKNNIRLVVHFHMPTQIESFIQEIGRAGRDGDSSVSLVLLSPTDRFLPNKLIANELPPNQKVASVISYLNKEKMKSKKIAPVEMQRYFELTEIQWRFLHFHLEKHGVVKALTINPDFHDWKALEAEITTVIKNRNEYKYSKLSELFLWANSNECRRSSLYSSFQETITKPKFACCDRCDFSFEQWNPKLVKQRKKLISWQEDFRQLMLQGDDDAFKTSRIN